MPSRSLGWLGWTTDGPHSLENVSWNTRTAAGNDHQLRGQVLPLLRSPYRVATRQLHRWYSAPLLGLPPLLPTPACRRDSWL